MHFSTAMLSKLTAVKQMARYVKSMDFARVRHTSTSDRQYRANTGTNTSPTRDSDTYIVDLRSDTMTKPSQSMRVAMMTCPVGDDVFQEDPTVNELQNRICSLFGKEAALFVASGTMGNLISIMSHCNQRGQEALIGDKSHILLYEQGGIAQIAGVNPRIFRNLSDGTADITDIKDMIRIRTDPHQPHTGLICLENTHGNCGGKVIPVAFQKEVRELADENDFRVHLDGARLMNAATALKCHPHDILQHVHSVSMCFSKGLSSPVGSIIAGSAEFIERARRHRKVLGGGMRQAGVLAACALISLDEAVPHLEEDHKKAQILAQGIVSANSNMAHVDPEGVHTNMVFAEISNGLTPKQLAERLKQVTDQEVYDLHDQVIVKAFPFTAKHLRFVTHCDITIDDMHRVVRKLRYILQESAN